MTLTVPSKNTSSSAGASLPMQGAKLSSQEVVKDLENIFGFKITKLTSRGMIVNKDLLQAFYLSDSESEAVLKTLNEQGVLDHQGFLNSDKFPSLAKLIHSSYPELSHMAKNAIKFAKLAYSKMSSATPNADPKIKSGPELTSDEIYDLSQSYKRLGGVPRDYRLKESSMEMFGRDGDKALDLDATGSRELKDLESSVKAQMMINNVDSWAAMDQLMGKRATTLQDNTDMIREAAGILGFSPTGSVPLTELLNKMALFGIKNISIPEDYGTQIETAELQAIILQAADRLLVSRNESISTEQEGTTVFFGSGARTLTSKGAMTTLLIRQRINSGETESFKDPKFWEGFFETSVLNKWTMDLIEPYLRDLAIDGTSTVGLKIPGGLDSAGNAAAKAIRNVNEPDSTKGHSGPADASNVSSSVHDKSYKLPAEPSDDHEPSTLEKMLINLKSKSASNIKNNSLFLSLFIVREFANDSSKKVVRPDVALEVLSAQKADMKATEDYNLRDTTVKLVVDKIINGVDLSSLSSSKAQALKRLGIFYREAIPDVGVRSHLEALLT
jgi:hypothetical protein